MGGRNLLGLLNKLGFIATVQLNNDYTASNAFVFILVVEAASG